MSKIKSKTKHRILTESINNDGFARTTHQRVSFDFISETFIVDFGDVGWIEVFGKNRFDRAIQIADNFNLLR